MRPVVIAGPTASGKSALALAVAERDRGVVINADASQVYACWRVLTARPDDAALARAPHRLYGHVGCDAPYSAGAWLREVAAEIADARACGLRPIIVGGTGLYLSLLTEGVAAIPPVPAEVRAASDDLLRGQGIDPLVRDLARRDPETLARIDARNPRRVQRAWEVLAATGRGLSAWQRETGTPLLPAKDCAALVASVEVIRLNSLIEQRFSAMLRQDAVEECRAFLARGFPADAPPGRVLGAPQIFAYLRNECTLEAAAAAAVTATRQYAKRQRTWFRNRMADWPRIDPSVPNALDGISPE